MYQREHTPCPAAVPLTAAVAVRLVYGSTNVENNSNTPFHSAQPHASRNYIINAFAFGITARIPLRVIL